MSQKADSSLSVQAGFWRRLIALLVDTAILSLVLGVFVWFAPLVAGELGLANPRPGLSLVALVIVAVISALYFIVGWSAWGKTAGKKVAGLQVVARDGGRVGVPRAMLRLAGYGVSFVSVALGGISLMDRDSRRLELHDRLSRTNVVRSSHTYTYRGPVLTSEKPVQVREQPVGESTPPRSFSVLQLLVSLALMLILFLGLWVAGGLSAARMHASAGAVVLFNGTRGNEPALGAIFVLIPLTLNLIGFGVGIRWILGGRAGLGWGTAIAAAAALVLVVSVSYAF